MREIETPRLVLRPCRAEDLGPLHALCTDPAVRRFLFDDRVPGEPETRGLVEASASRFEKRGFGLWLVHAKGDPTLAGFAGLLGDDDAAPRLVYAIRPDFAGRGLASEAARGVLDHVRRTLGIAEVAAEVDEPNRASLRVLEKLGFRRVGRALVDDRPLLRFAFRGGAERP